MRVLGMFALIAALPIGCGSDVDPSVSGVFPSGAFLGRQVRVEVSGDVSEWSNNATVNFGDGITVDSVDVASPTALFAEITVAPDADPGLRSVTVTDGGRALVLEDAFELESAIEVRFQGQIAQGSLAQFTITNRDFFSPFDTTSTGGGLFTPPEFVNIELATGPGVRLQVGSVDVFSITGTAFFDIDAVPGAVEVRSGPVGDQTISSLGVDLAVEPRTAMPLTLGTPVSGTVTKAFDSFLYEINVASAPAIAQLQAIADSPAGSPQFAILPASGKFEDLISFGQASDALVETAGKLYIVYFDIDGGSGYGYALNSRNQPLTAQAEQEPNNTPAAARTGTPPVLVNASTLTDIGDEDWITFTVAAGDVGKDIRVLTSGADLFTDTFLEVFSGNNCQIPQGDPSDDLGFHEDITVTAVAGRMCVKVSASPFFDPASDAYVLAVWIQ